ncbi:hypothetical protein J3A83DRAFT_4378408 [Scleroderma citrinum]
MCFAMQDYPEDGGSGMSQIYHGEKMLLDLPSHPAACVHRKIYFMDEILQETEEHDTAQPKELYALGHTVTWTEAGFVVNDVQEIVLTTMFMHSFKDLSTHPTECACGLTESSKKLATLGPNLIHEKANG